MSPLEMIVEWRKGCTNSMEYSEDGTYLGQHLHPELCPECTRGLIEALEARLGAWQQPCNFGGHPPVYSADQVSERATGREEAYSYSCTLPESYLREPAPPIFDIASRVWLDGQLIIDRTTSPNR